MYRNTLYEYVYIISKYCCYKIDLYIFGPPKQNMLIYVAHITNCFHAIRISYRHIRINSSTFLFHTILPSTFFFCGVRAAYHQTFLDVYLSHSTSCTLLLAVCVSLSFFSVFSSHEKKTTTMCCVLLLFFFSSPMPMAFYYSLFGNCSWLFQVNSFVHFICFVYCFFWLVLLFGFERGGGKEKHITYKWLPSKQNENGFRKHSKQHINFLYNILRIDWIGRWIHFWR